MRKIIKTASDTSYYIIISRYWARHFYYGEDCILAIIGTDNCYTEQVTPPTLTDALSFSLALRYCKLLSDGKRWLVRHRGYFLTWLPLTLRVTCVFLRNPRGSFEGAGLLLPLVHHKTSLFRPPKVSSFASEEGAHVTGTLPLITGICTSRLGTHGTYGKEIPIIYITTATTVGDLAPA